MGSNIDGRHVITTHSTDAAARYREGLTLVVESSPAARAVLGAALAADGQLAVAHAALAVVLAEDGFARDADAAMTQAHKTVHLATRRERQHVEVIGLLVDGDVRRAHALGAEHLLEYAGDRLIEWLIAT
jgi:hypothetical protein